ncbi:DUF1674 domain-containing protein [Lysobacter sp. CAU 1642]|uniref:DUF1674 domain-containing protein n=1 Tax=Pseudomarimonas salicorniae TaxID=2933270 RepID=A0ABT0GFJ0_9GAMM|nr:DUF1674 domain-containing protein [Lysobacter sp. CAU 1642]
MASSGEGEHQSADQGTEQERKPTEVGGRDGPDPTRYGDWEKNGRCIDF